ncbi:unnamed protein product [Paramecium pentaurelia]|uniref:Uncharacterized protein n=1 Tax=Paramecium pentaurelia TaxID=43138 RepID=A0A8S1VNF4_9CILI|nr:unnamed protein product [Paramecium pentaurelia]
MLNLKTKKHSFSIQKRQYWTQNDNKLLEKVVKLHNSDSKTILLEEMEVNVHSNSLFLSIYLSKIIQLFSLASQNTFTQQGSSCYCLNGYIDEFTLDCIANITNP